jgi:predicted ATPase
MITRIEIDGFKSFLDFHLDVPPLLALVGPNAGGKSNLLDAIGYEAAARAGRQPLLESRRCWSIWARWRRPSLRSLETKR